MANATITPQDISPLLEGLAIMGTGGGGNPDWGRMILEQDARMGREWTLIDPDDVADDATIVCGGIMGSVKKLEEIGFANVLDGWESYFPLQEVTNIMSGLLGRRIDAMIPFESGGLNTPIVLTLCARMGIPAVNGDALGRSAPETNMTSFIGHGIQIPPMPLIDQFGNVVIVQEAEDPTYPDEIGRFVVSKGGYMGANNHYPMSGAQLKQAVIPHTITGALELGRKVQVARSLGEDPISVIAEHFNAPQQYRFHGRITSLQEEESMGFYFTTASLTGIDGSAGHHAELVIKNETMLYKLDGSVICMFPDIALMLEPGTGRGIMSVELQDDFELVVLATPCHSRLQAAATSEVGRRAMSPARYGQAESTYQAMH